MTGLLPLALLVAVLAMASPGAYLRAHAAARLIPTPLVLGLRLRDLYPAAGARAARLGLTPAHCAAFAAGLLAVLAVVGSRPDAAGAVATAWALVLAAICDRRFGLLPPFLSVVACLGAAGALLADEIAGTGLHGGTADILAALFISASVEIAVRAQASSSGRRVLGQGDPPLMFALFAWAGPVGGVLAFVAALLLVLAEAIVGGRRTGAHAPLGVALAAATMPFVLMPAAAREIVDSVVLWFPN